LNRLIGILLFLVFGLQEGVIAQYKMDPKKSLDQYNYDHWTSEEGLPDNAVIHLLQSKDGYIWFASYGGITRFNGVDFLTYSSFNTTSIVNNSFTYIYEDSHGVIWTATSGNGAVTVENGEIKIYTMEDGLPSNFIEEIVQDRNGRIWIATSDGLSYKKDTAFSSEEVPKLLKTLRLKSIDVDEDNTLWVGTTDQGVYQMKDGQIINYYNQENGLISDNINYIEAIGHAVWVGTDEGLSIIKDGKVINETPADGLPNNMTSCFLLDDNGMRWLGTFRGMGRLDSANNWTYFSDGHPLYDNDFTSFIQDDEGSIWIGTYRQGLFRLWDGKFTNYSKKDDQELQQYIVHCILQKDDNSLFVISESSIDVLFPDQNRFEPYNVGHDFSDTKLKFALTDSKGRLWIATQDYLVRYKDGVTKVYNTENGLINNSVRVLHEDKDHNIWAGTTNGISVIKENGEIKNYTVKNGLSHEYIMSIRSDSKGNIWIGTRNGLNVFKEDHFLTYYTKDGLAGEFVFKTFEDSDGVMWVCGNAGLTRFKNGVFTKITTRNGLSSNTLFQMLEDDKGYFWFTTNQKNISVFKVRKKELNDLADGRIDSVESINYSQADGLKGSAATSSSMSLETRDGRLWFATVNGVEMIEPGHIKKNNRKPPVKIESFMVNGQNFRVDSSIVIPFGKNRITLRYAALSYIASDRIAYKYKLEGYDEEWLNPDKKRETSYTNLPSGKYTFHVKAANSDGVWNDEGASISFYIKPPFYQTPWFIGVSLVVIILIIRMIYKLRVRSLERAKQELANEVETRTVEVVKQKEEIEKQKKEIEEQQKQIEHKNQELLKINTSLEDMVEERTEQLKKAYNELVDVNKELDTFIYRSVHDVRGPLARLQGLSHLISLETNDPNILKLVNKLNFTADEMNDVFYSLLNIARLKSAKLTYSLIRINEVSKHVLRKLDPEGEKIDFKISVKDDFELFTDESILEVILYHLFENAVKFRRDGQKAQILLECKRLSNGEASIKVKDRGLGVVNDIADKIFDMFYVGQEKIQGTGLGLYTVKTAVKVLKGRIALIENARVDEFTTFEVRLPVNENFAVENATIQAAQ